MSSLAPYSDADATLRALAGRAEGFGRLAVGGLDGSVYHVTTLADDGDGSLRVGCSYVESLWIIFHVSGTLRLSSPLIVSSYKTIDGRGQRVKITGHGLQLMKCEHVIVCNLEFEGGRGHDADAIKIKDGSRHIWIDRCSLSDFDDGLIDVTRGSTDVTISRCKFSAHNKVMLIGADSGDVGDRCIRVTIHHCFFDGTRQRHPRVRFGKVHLYNNYTRKWGLYGVCASVESQIISQCNIYEAGESKVVLKYMTEKAADTEEEASGSMISQGDLFLGEAQLGSAPNREACGVFCASEFYTNWSMELPTQELMKALETCTGWQPIPRPEDAPLL
ncbi:putative pectate lyase 21 [Wolffia australiana]